jgi:hypothetical protein
VGRFDAAFNFYRMIRDRGSWILAPLLIAIVLVLAFVTVAEMPILIPFFYAVF